MNLRYNFLRGVRVPFGLFFLLICMFQTSAQAQTVTLTGKVTDAGNGDPLPGVTVQVVGQTSGGITNSSGVYAFKIAPGSYTLRASFVGYKPQTATVTVARNGANVKDFSLAEDLLGGSEVVVLGTRREDRVVTDSPVPIDVITPRDIQTTGATETMQVIQALIPSYNAPQSSVTDGTDHIKVATLRGLAPDQMLVLINGKRQHTSSLVNVNGSIGRGSTGIDMNAIPAAAIERIEVLRDGAAAQYGSDAIAGVINIILKHKPGVSASVTYGQFASNQELGYTEDEGIVVAPNGNIYTNPGAGLPVPSTQTKAGAFNWDAAGEAGTQRIGNAPVYNVKRNDGQNAKVNLGYGLALGEKGSVYLSAELNSRDRITRAGLDPRRNYFGINADGTLNTSQTAGTDDPREKTFDRQNFQYGPGDLDATTLFLNSNYNISEKANLYAFGGYSARVGLTGCNFRQASANNTIRAIYPDGFLPLINGQVKDYTAAVGMKGAMGEWSYDASVKTGQNTLRFNMQDVINVSYGTLPTQQQEIDSGALNLAQTTTNLDFYRQVKTNLASPLSVAVGAEYRREHYFISEGELISYADGGQKVLDGPNKGATPAFGCQCFPGFSPKSAAEADAKRSSVGAYLDLETNVTKAWLLSAAARFENYSDFGNNFSWKVATKFDVTEAIGIRGAVSTGFRAPSLPQSNFTTISTNFINGVPFEVGTFRVASPIAKALGAKDLKPETSFNVSAGLTVNTGNFALTIDAYQIDMKDRITFTENFTGTAVQKFLESKGVFGSNGGRFFINAVNTTTKGMDITGRYGMKVGEGNLRVSLGVNLNKTEVTNSGVSSTNKFNRLIPVTPELASIDPNFVNQGLFGRARIGDYESAQPKDKESLTFQYDVSNLAFNLRIIRYGEYTTVTGSLPDATTGINPLDQTFGAKVLTDAEATYKFKKNFSLSVGGNNLLDVYPDKVYKTFSNSGIYQYDSFTPFGFNGRYIYSRLNVSF